MLLMLSNMCILVPLTHANDEAPVHKILIKGAYSALPGPDTAEQLAGAKSWDNVILSVSAWGEFKDASYARNPESLVDAIRCEYKSKLVEAITYQTSFVWVSDIKVAPTLVDLPDFDVISYVKKFIRAPADLGVPEASRTSRFDNYNWFTRLNFEKLGPDRVRIRTVKKIVGPSSLVVGESLEENIHWFYVPKPWIKKNHNE